MSVFPDDLRFIHEWRPYQGRLLEELHDHLHDRHLHIVAAPGAGKTVLGLEVIRQLGVPALVLVPSLTIRGQWLKHFRDVFQSEDPNKAVLASSALDAPAALTVSTYQALYSAGFDDDAELPEALMQIETLVLDEAHHLRNEWWKSLVSLRERLPELRVVSLTATPPYDVPPREWNRYFEMCGPIDAIISIPELVKAGNLCPHEDYVFFSVPEPAESAAITAFREQVDRLQSWLLSEPDFARALLGHPWFSKFDSDTHRESVFEHPELFSAMIVCLEAMGHECGAQKDYLGVAGETTPKPDEGWFEILLTELISDRADRFDLSEGFRRELRQRLSAMHVVHRKKVVLTNPESLDRSLRHSESKLDSVVAIVGKEHAALGDALRMVVLTDYVQGGQVRSGGTSRRLGAVPILDRVREQHGTALRAGLLTGNLVIVPRQLRELLSAAMQRHGASDAPRFIPLPADGEYLQINVDSGTRLVVTAAVTDLLNAGELHVLVGTVALLGQGWDAPATNTLVIASATSSYVQTNQVRGRAIRIDPANPRKVSNIWHLVCVEPDTGHGGSDFHKLRTRFSAFEGLSYDDDTIRSGFERLFEAPARWTEVEVARLNARSTVHAAARDRIRHGWEKALEPTSDARVNGIVEEVSVGRREIVDSRVLKHPARRSLLPLTVLGGYIPAAMLVLPVTAGAPPIVWALHGAALGGLIHIGRIPRLMRDWWQVMRNGMGPAALRRVAEAILESLCEAEVITTSRASLSLSVTPWPGGRTVCSLRGGTLRDADVFVRCMEEVLDPVENPRYLLFHPHRSWRRARRGDGDYHAVPSALGRRREAEILARHWRRLIGRCELVYTRRAEGRVQLLKARARAWVNLGRKMVSRQSVWR